MVIESEKLLHHFRACAKWRLPIMTSIVNYNKIDCRTIDGLQSFLYK